MHFFEGSFLENKSEAWRFLDVSTIQRTNQAVKGNRAAAQPRAAWELLKIPHLGRPAPAKVSGQAAGCEHRGGSGELRGR